MNICGWEDQRGSGTSVSLISCGGGGGNASWMWVGQDRTGHTAEQEEGKGGCTGSVVRSQPTECRSVVGNRRAGAFEIMIS